MKVQITCTKDRLVEKACRDAFTKKFEKFLRTKRWHPYDATNAMVWNLAKEAHRQEWYDFEVIDGQRKALVNEDGTPKLLVPEVKIVDHPIATPGTY